MAAKQSMMQAITQATIEVAKATNSAVNETENLVIAASSVQVLPRTGSPTPKRQRTNTKNYKTLK